uniref:Methionine aminopeptidase n=1 Tax=Fibrocapsa japonica TaxID=94617 RepID=A0A7S2UT99_9STRA|mmetsp:Transcript_12320/g.18152  ORF Transcript_12320/g.18152 Transcript_12320/m.18152 type:complete len:336 (+) Transcript_12320:81-1088(+)
MLRYVRLCRNQASKHFCPFSPKFLGSFLSQNGRRCFFSFSKPFTAGTVSPTLPVPVHIEKPMYSESGEVPPPDPWVHIHTAASIEKMRIAGRIARQSLDLACSLAKVGRTTDEIDGVVHEMIVSSGAYPAPRNYKGFPKSLVTAINQVICHGIPDDRPLQYGDVASFDASVYVGGVFGDNCATVIVGDDGDDGGGGEGGEEVDVEGARRLVKATQECLDAGIAECGPGKCLSSIGHAIEAVADSYGYQSVRAYCGHGIGTGFHMLPFVQHFRNDDRLELRPGMIFTIEPMITEGSQESVLAEDNWTVYTRDGKRAAQFEHTVLITEDGVEVITVP